MTDFEACKRLLGRIRRREPVTAPELRRALGEDHWNDYQLLCKWVKGQREEAKNASHELSDYVRLLRIADLYEAQPNPNRGNKREGGLRRTSSTAKYEQALQRLSELIEGNESLAHYLDRPFWLNCWDSSSNISAEKDGVPRLWFHPQNALPPIAERER